jgi:glycosyltransferase involved in cell wall biosynthesis
MTPEITVKTPRPLITFVVMAFNQQKFIGDAVEAAFSQTYSPLEIVLSDDASKDETFNIMSKMREEYTGNHTIILNRNECQQGLGAHLDKIMEIAKGELIVVSAGDDISVAERTETVFRAWDSSGRCASSIYSDYISIAEDGHKLEAPPSPPVGRSTPAFEFQATDLASFVTSLTPLVSGCTHAFIPRLFTYFGPLTNSVTFEDMALTFRSHAIGRLLYIKHPLVFYRRHGNNLSSHHFDRKAMDGDMFGIIERKEQCQLQGHLRGYEGFARDLETLAQHHVLGSDQKIRIGEAIQRRKREYELRLALITGDFMCRLRSFYELCENGRKARHHAAWAARCFPRGVYKMLRIAKNRYKTRETKDV